MTLFLTCALTLSASLVSAQNVYACEDYTSSGDPIGVGATWTIKPEGGYVYLLYNQSRTITDDAIYFFIDILQGGEYEEFDTELVTPDAGKNWALLDYKFTKAGEYRVEIINSSYETVASTYLTINMKGGTTNNNNSSNNNTGSGGDVDTYYYSDSEVIACEEVKNNTPQNVATTFNIGRNGGYVTFQVDNGKAMKTTELIVDIYMKPKGGSDYSEFVETKYFTIEEHWDKPYFQYTFYDAGEYKLAIYNKESTWINNGYVTINKR